MHQILTEGLEKGMKTFGETLNIAPIDAKMMSQPADTEEGRIEQYKRTMFWSEFEIRQYAFFWMISQNTAIKSPY